MQISPNRLQQLVGFCNPNLIKILIVVNHRNIQCIHAESCNLLVHPLSFTGLDMLFEFLSADMTGSFISYAVLSFQRELFYFLQKFFFALLMESKNLPNFVYAQSQYSFGFMFDVTPSSLRKIQENEKKTQSIFCQPN